MDSYFYIFFESINDNYYILWTSLAKACMLRSFTWSTWIWSHLIWKSTKVAIFYLKYNIITLVYCLTPMKSSRESFYSSLSRLMSKAPPCLKERNIYSKMFYRPALILYNASTILKLDVQLKSAFLKKTKNRKSRFRRLSGPLRQCYVIWLKLRRRSKRS